MILKNLKIVNAHVTGNSRVGVLAVNPYTGTSIENCHVSGVVKVLGYYKVGGLAGQAYVTNILNCSVTGDSSCYVQGRYLKADFEGDNVGGLIGFRAEGPLTISDCYTDIDVYGTRKVGGLAGSILYGSTVANCSAAGDVHVIYAEGYRSMAESADVVKLAFGSLIGEAHPYASTLPVTTTIKDNVATGNIVMDDPHSVSPYPVSPNIGLIGAARGYTAQHSSDMRTAVTNCTYTVPVADFGKYPMISGTLINGGKLLATEDPDLCPSFPT